MDCVKLDVDSPLKREHSPKLRKTSLTKQDVITRKFQIYMTFRGMYLFAGNRNTYSETSHTKFFRIFG
jgi:hypothetical protein